MFAGERVRVAHQRRAAVMVDDALRIAGRAGRVVQADRIPFVGGHAPGKIRVALGEERLVVERADPRALLRGRIGRKFGIVEIDDQRLAFGALQRVAP